MSLYIQQLAKLIGIQLGRLYRHFGANSDGAAWFLICTSLTSQHAENPPSQSPSCELLVTLSSVQKEEKIKRNKTVRTRLICTQE